jgi:hypothetical protein
VSSFYLPQNPALYEVINDLEAGDFASANFQLHKEGLQNPLFSGAF